MFERNGIYVRNQVDHDEGIDIEIELTENGSGTGKIAKGQVKTGSSYQKRNQSGAFSFYFSDKKKAYWTEHTCPVFIAFVNDVSREVYLDFFLPDNIIKTSRKYKIEILESQKLTPEKLLQLADSIWPITTNKDYELITENDQSLAGARRIDRRIKLLPAGSQLTKSRLIALARLATFEAIKSTYYRSNLTKNVHHSRDADIVWLYFFLSDADDRNSNWICASQWISPRLPDSARPVWSFPEPIGSEIRFSWNKDYKKIASLYADRTMTKAQAFDFIDAYLPVLERLASKALSNFEKSTAELLRDDDIDRLNQIEEALQRGAFPTECKHIDERIHELILDLQNAILISKNPEYSQRNKEFLLPKYLRSANEKPNYIKYEVQKVR